MRTFMRKNLQDVILLLSGRARAVSVMRRNQKRSTVHKTARSVEID